MPGHIYGGQLTECIYNIIALRTKHFMDFVIFKYPQIKDLLLKIGIMYSFAYKG